MSRSPTKDGGSNPWIAKLHWTDRWDPRRVAQWRPVSAWGTSVLPLLLVLLVILVVILFLTHERGEFLLFDGAHFR